MSNYHNIKYTDYSPGNTLSHQENERNYYLRLPSASQPPPATAVTATAVIFPSSPLPSQ